MEKYPKHLVTTRSGVQVMMNDAALRIAEKHFGVSKAHTIPRETPIEILKLPSEIDIIKAEVKVVPAVDEKQIEHDIAIESIKKTRKQPVKSKSAK